MICFRFEATAEIAVLLLHFKQIQNDREIESEREEGRSGERYRMKREW